jgi:hypothetical protein
MTHLTIDLDEVDDSEQRHGAYFRIRVHVIVTAQNHRCASHGVDAMQDELSG